MARVVKIGSLVLLLIAPAIALGDVFPILVAATGKLNDAPSSNVTSITVFDGSVNGQVHSPPLLQGAVAAETIGAINRAWMIDHPDVPPEASGMLIGLDGGTAALGLGGDASSAVAAWFASPVRADGNDLTSEIFVVDWGKSLDDYQVQLLTSDANAGIAGAVVATTVQVRVSDQIQTTTTLDTLGGGDDQILAGVGIDLDSEALGGADILGVLIPADDGFGGLSGVDPAIIAAIGPESPIFEADFDEDGDVDGDDFLLWRTGFPTPSGATKMNGDYDNDGDVDGDDFLGWQAEFPSPGGASSNAVPEPNSLFIVALGAIVGLLRRREHRYEGGS